jgi:hypothetical protein
MAPTVPTLQAQRTAALPPPERSKHNLSTQPAAAAAPPSREALINSLFAFILEFLFNARNQSTRIVSYLRRLMTRHWIKIHMKFDSANESVIP